MEEWKQNLLLGLVGFVFLYLVYKKTTEPKEDFGEITRWKKPLRDEHELNEEDYRRLALKQERKRQKWNESQWEKQSQWENNRLLDDIQIVKSVANQKV